jgi:serine O-acetyltransferase
MKSTSVIKYFCSYGYLAVYVYLLSRYLRNKGWICRKLSNFVLLYCKHATGLEISSHCVIGSNLTIAYGMNIIIGGDTVIGQNAIIYDGFTFGTSG